MCVFIMSITSPIFAIKTKRSSDCGTFLSIFGDRTAYVAPDVTSSAPALSLRAMAFALHMFTPQLCAATTTGTLALMRDSSIERDSSTDSESYPSPALEKLLEAVAQMRVPQPKEGGRHELKDGEEDDFHEVWTCLGPYVHLPFCIFPARWLIEPKARCR